MLKSIRAKGFSDRLHFVARTFYFRHIMNSSEIKDRASSFFARLKVYAAYAVRYIVFICRKYPFLAAIFLLFYAFFLYRYLSPNSIKTNNLPIPQQTQQTQAITSSQTTNQTTPVIEAAQATAVRSGTDLSIRWDRPVENKRFAPTKVRWNQAVSLKLVR
ncbi:MAG: hypothetical protein HC764_08475 [Pleurocapsa sp. CRU_1_2]|nr:hypothetical protein [Pleurocapsa sp. CRU_1_2]